MSAGLPVALAGSSTPQWLRNTGPRYAGQVSPAALAHTVMTISGVTGSASQDLLAQSLASMPSAASSASERGCTSPVGWLPALSARQPAGARWLKVASARMERQELPVHKNRIFIQGSQAGSEHVGWAPDSGGSRASGQGDGARRLAHCSGWPAQHSALR